jgi:hypothetical protein
VSNAVTFTLTARELREIVAAHIAATLTPERVARIARAEVRERVGTLTLAEAAPYLQCKNVRQLRDACRAYGIPVVKLGVKKEFVRIADIEGALRRYALTLPAADASNGTRIAPAPNVERRAA